MGTWGTGPFDNVTAADFGGDLDDAGMDEREPMVRSALRRAANSADFLIALDAERAVSAASLVSSHSTLAVSLHARATGPRSRCRSFLQISARSPLTPWTKCWARRLNSPSCGTRPRTAQNGATA